MKTQVKHNSHYRRILVNLYKRSLRTSSQELIAIPLKRDEKGRLASDGNILDWATGQDVVDEWISNYGPRNTKESYLYQLRRFCKHYNLTPAEILDIARRDVREIKIKAVKLAKQLEHNGNMVSGNLVLVALRSFLDHYDIELRIKRREKVKVMAKKIHREHIPSKEEIYRMAEMSPSLRDKAMIICAFQSGVRPGCLIKWRYKDIKACMDDDVKIPLTLRITSDMDTKMKGYGLGFYFSFLSHEGIEVLRNYIAWRMKKWGWQPQDDDLLFIREKSRKLAGIKNCAFWMVIKRACERAGLDSKKTWAHLLRKAFRNKLRVINDIQVEEAMMGHKLPGSQHNYFNHKAVEEFRAAYMRVNWTREGIGRLAQLEEHAKDQNGYIKALEDRIDELTKSHDKNIDFDIEVLNLQEQVKALSEEVKRLSKRQITWETISDRPAKKHKP